MPNLIFEPSLHIWQSLGKNVINPTSFPTSFSGFLPHSMVQCGGMFNTYRFPITVKVELQMYVFARLKKDKGVFIVYEIGNFLETNGEISPNASIVNLKS